MIYKIKKQRNGLFRITRHSCSYDEFKFEIRAKRILQFDSALLVQHENNNYDLYLASTQSSVSFPTLVTGHISQYRVFRNSVGHQKCILALKIENYWTFLVPKSFGFFIHLPEILIGRLETMPKLPVIDSNLPAYFKQGFEDTLEFIFHANGKDYLISSKSTNFDSTDAQVNITEFTEIMPLLPESYFKAVSETGEYLFWNSCLYGQYSKLEPFAEEDYPEEFNGQYGYWGKDADGNILGLHIINSKGSKNYTIKFEKPVKSIHFHSRTYTDTVNKYYYDIWQVTYLDSQRQLKLKTNINGSCPDMLINENTWNF